MLVYLRRFVRAILGPSKVTFGTEGENVTVEPLCNFGHPQNIHIGSNVFIGEATSIYALGGCTIKDGAILADHVDIRTANHHYDGPGLESVPFDKKIFLQSVVIEENVWIASHAVILPGVTVGEGAVVAAGAIVTKDVPPLAVVGGNPARVIKYRDADLYNRLKAEGKHYFTLDKEKSIQYIPKEK